MEKCRQLKDYSMLIASIRRRIKMGKPKEEAVELAVDECIKNGILKDMLEKHRGEGAERPVDARLRRPEVCLTAHVSKG